MEQLQNTPIKSHPYDLLACDLIRALRGTQSQRELSRRMGYSFNQVGKWESGVTRPKWSDFLNLCQNLDIPIEKYFKSFFWNFEGVLDSQNMALEIQKSFYSAAEVLDPTAKLVNKWAQGISQPDLADMLKVLDSKTGILIGFLCQFVKAEEIPLLAEKMAWLNRQIDAVSENPIFVYINSALQLQEYQDLESHDEKLLAEHSTCTRADLRSALNQMMALEMIRFDGKKYLASPFSFSFSSSANLKLRSLTRYTTNLAASRYSSAPAKVPMGRTFNPSVSSVRVNALSETAAKKAQELVMRFHNEMADIVAQDNQSKAPKKNVQVFLIHSFASNINSPTLEDSTNTQLENRQADITKAK